MRIFQFLKRYKDFNKLISELNRLEVRANSEKLKNEYAASNNSSTLSSYYRKKAEYSRGKQDAYKKILKLFSEFMKTGEISEIENKENKNN